MSQKNPPPPSLVHKKIPSTCKFYRPSPPLPVLKVYSLNTLANIDKSSESELDSWCQVILYNLFMSARIPYQFWGHQYPAKSIAVMFSGMPDNSLCLQLSAYCRTYHKHPICCRHRCQLTNKTTWRCS